MTCRPCSVGFHGHSDPCGDCPGCQEVAREAKASNDRLDAAVDILARGFLRRLVIDGMPESVPPFSSLSAEFSSLTAEDWIRIRDRAIFLTDVNQAEYDETYEWMAGRHEW